MATAALRFEMRVATFSPATPEDTWACALEMARWADELGFLSITLSEHHCVEDGHLSSPLTLAGALLGATQRIGVNVSALLIPLYDPIRLAEDIATLDLLARGRFSITTGLGYREQEYRACGKDFSKRGQLLDHALDTMLQAWSGEPFEYNGGTIRVTPRPYSRPHPPIVIGGSNPVSARRAARLGLPFGPPLHDPKLNQLYLDECAKHAVEAPSLIDPGESWMLYCADDRDEGWNDIGPYWLNDALQYASWQRSDQRSYQLSSATTLAELRAEGKYRVMTPDECIELAKQRGADFMFHHFPMGGGAPPEIGWKSLRCFADKVIPHIDWKH